MNHNCPDCVPLADHDAALDVFNRERERNKKERDAARSELTQQYTKVAELEIANSKLHTGLHAAEECNEELKLKLRDSEEKNMALLKRLDEMERKRKEDEAEYDRMLEELKRKLKALSSLPSPDVTSVSSSSPSSVQGSVCADVDPTFHNLRMDEESPAVAEQTKDQVDSLQVLTSSLDTPPVHSGPTSTELRSSQDAFPITPISPSRAKLATSVLSRMKGRLTSVQPSSESTTPSSATSEQPNEISDESSGMSHPEQLPMEPSPEIELPSRIAEPSVPTSMEQSLPMPGSLSTPNRLSTTEIHTQLPNADKGNNDETVSKLTTPSVPNGSSPIKPISKPRRGSRLEVNKVTRIVRRPSSSSSTPSFTQALKVGHPRGHKPFNSSAYKKPLSTQPRVERPRPLQSAPLKHSKSHASQSNFVASKSDSKPHFQIQAGSSVTPDITAARNPRLPLSRASKAALSNASKVVVTDLAVSLTHTMQDNVNSTSLHPVKRKAFQLEPSSSILLHKRRRTRNNAYVLVNHADRSWDVHSLSELGRPPADIDLTVSDEESDEERSVRKALTPREHVWKEESFETDEHGGRVKSTAENSESCEKSSAGPTAVLSLFDDSELSDLTDSENGDEDAEGEPDVFRPLDEHLTGDSMPAGESFSNFTSGVAGDNGSNSARNNMAPRTCPTATRNVKSEVKQEEVGLNTLDETSRGHRLDGVATFPVQTEEHISSVTVTRQFLSTKYGGSPQGLYPIIDRRAHKHNYHLFFPTLQNNPDAPRKPGDAGLLYRTIPQVPWGNQTLKMFVKLKANNYLYMGDYQIIPTTPLSQEEFQRLPLKTKRAWARLILSRSKERRIRARILLRKKLDREPTQGEVSTFVSQYPRDRFAVSIDDAVDAYSCGQETFYIFLLQCVGYDDAFQRELANTFPARAPASSAHPLSAKKPKSSAVCQKRPRHAMEEDDDDSEYSP
ncbi:unnamed protein product [Somion occarium]|uniref:DUF6697 domain-containing protein n=1 Tax=Somion occarium TaxID=3059160 RepID=A0ABP1DHJ8_9APHY